MNKFNSEPENKWWKNEDNLPCIITNSERCTLMAIVIYSDHCGNLYDYKGDKYKAVGSIWRRATKKEILNNIKGL